LGGRRCPSGDRLRSGHRRAPTTSPAGPHTNRLLLLHYCHREVREARRGDPDGSLRRSATGPPRNDSKSYGRSVSGLGAEHVESRTVKLAHERVVARERQSGKPRAQQHECAEIAAAPQRFKRDCSFFTSGDTAPQAPELPQPDFLFGPNHVHSRYATARRAMPATIRVWREEDITTKPRNTLNTRKVIGSTEHTDTGRFHFRVFGVFRGDPTSMAQNPAARPTW
jgi:hypothetical protein